MDFQRGNVCAKYWLFGEAAVEVMLIATEAAALIGNSV
jgi:hypothetical protein